MKRVQFLTKAALKADRPDWVKMLTNTIFYVTGIGAIVMMGISSIPEDFKTQANEWIIVGNLIIKFISHGTGEVRK